MLELGLIQQFLVALALGLLIGLEREYARYKKRGHDYAGIRTFPLIALFGALAAFLGEKISVMILIVSIILIGILILIAYFMISHRSAIGMGATSEIAGFITFFIGVLSYYQEYSLAVIITVIMAVILYARSLLHHFAERIKDKELADTLKFAVVVFIVLPFLPDQGYGPYGLFNPYLIWLMVIFISGISFAGYILLKWFGERGITLAGILGGLVSSTAVTLSFAERSRKEKTITLALVLGVILANGVMFVRILTEVFVLNRDLFLHLLIPLLTLAVITVIFAYFLWRKIGAVKGNIHLDSPFRLGPALKFGIFFSVVIGVVKLADVFLSAKGVYIVSAFSGIADVDAITVSLSQLAKGVLPLATAKTGIMIAALTNVAVKGSMAYWFGGKTFGKMILSFYAALIIIGLLAVFLL